MRAYRVSTDYDVDELDDEGETVRVTGTAVRYAGTQADATKARQAMVDMYGVKKSAVAIEETEIPTDKAGLLEFINSLLED